jgi:hypothetical protein
MRNKVKQFCFVAISEVENTGFVLSMLFSAFAFSEN